MTKNLDDFFDNPETQEFTGLGEAKRRYPRAKVDDASVAEGRWCAVRKCPTVKQAICNEDSDVLYDHLRIRTFTDYTAAKDWCDSCHLITVACENNPKDHFIARMEPPLNPEDDPEYGFGVSDWVLHNPAELDALWNVIVAKLQSGEQTREQLIGDMTVTQFRAVTTRARIQGSLDIAYKRRAGTLVYKLRKTG
jgi:hypothetical protein